MCDILGLIFGWALCFWKGEITMAVKKFCDRCGEEIKPRQLFRPNGKCYDVVMEHTFRRWGYCGRTYELCHDCAMAIEKFLKNEEQL